MKYPFIVASIFSGWFTSTICNAQPDAANAPPQDIPIDAKIRAAIIDGAVKALNANYIFPDVAQQAAA